MICERSTFLEDRYTFFSNKGDHVLNMQLVEGNELLQNDQKIAVKLNTFFKIAVSNLKTRT